MIEDTLGVAGACAPDLTALHRGYQRSLQRYFGRFGLSAPDRDDLVQELFVKLFRSFRNDVLRNPEALVFTMARNLLRDHARRGRSRRWIETETVDTIHVASLAPTPDEMLELRERVTGAADALDRLKPTARAAFLMHRLDGVSYAMVAGSLGVSVSMVEKHIMSALATIRHAR